MTRASGAHDVKDEVVKLRLHHDEKSRLVEEADIAGITLSELIRRRSANKSIFARTDLAMLRELRRIGGLLKHIHNTSGGAYSVDTAAALSEVRETIRNLSRDH
jgi:phosphate uptake regulator